MISINEEEVVKLYEAEHWTLRRVADFFKTDHHRIRRILQKNNVTISAKGRRKPFSDQHRRKISEFHQGKSFNIGFKHTKETCYRNMLGHLKYDVDYSWLVKFDNIDKIKYLNHSISRRRDYEGYDSNTYIRFIEKFYYDSNFNKLYDLWVTTGDKWIKPSLDHIIPKSQGGSLLPENIQFISWLENRTKVDIDQSEWNKIKSRIYEYF